MAPKGTKIPQKEPKMANILDPFRTYKWSKVLLFLRVSGQKASQKAVQKRVKKGHFEGWPALGPPGQPGFKSHSRAPLRRKGI
jgi:hypothetical protein